MQLQGNTTVNRTHMIFLEKEDTNPVGFIQAATILGGGSILDPHVHRQQMQKPAPPHFHATSGSAVMSVCMTTHQSDTCKMVAACLY